MIQNDFIRMKAIKVIFSVLLVTAAACNPVSFSPDKFIEHSGDDIILMKNGVTLLMYKPASWQLSCSRDEAGEKYEYRVHDDNMGEYYVFTCPVPLDQEGKQVSALLEWTTSRANEVVTGEFIINKIEDGRIWLTCAKKHIGLVVKEVR